MLYFLRKFTIIYNLSLHSSKKHFTSYQKLSLRKRNSEVAYFFQKLYFYNILRIYLYYFILKSIDYEKVYYKATVAVLLGATTISMSGCYGSFALTSKLHDWNGQVSQKKFVNELVFLGLCILPAYELTVLGDGLIFNSIEFWGEKIPLP